MTNNEADVQPIDPQAELRLHLSLSVREYRRLVFLMKMAVSAEEASRQAIKDLPNRGTVSVNDQARAHLALINDQNFLTRLMRVAGPLTYRAPADDQWYERVLPVDASDPSEARS